MIGMIIFIMGAAWLASILLTAQLAYSKGHKQGSWDVNTNLVSIARFGNGIYTVTSPNHVIVYKVQSMTEIKKATK